MMNKKRKRELFETMKNNIAELGTIKKIGIGFEDQPTINKMRARMNNPPSLVGKTFEMALLLRTEEQLLAELLEEYPKRNITKLIKPKFIRTSTVTSEVMSLLGISVVKTESESCYITIDEMAEKEQNVKFLFPCKDTKIQKESDITGVEFTFSPCKSTLGAWHKTVQLKVADLISINGTPVVILADNLDVYLLI